MLHNKAYRAIKDALQAKGIEVVSGSKEGGRLVLLVERFGVQSKFTVNHPPKHDGGRWQMNLVRDVRKVLRSKGALFTKEEIAEDEAESESAPEPGKRRTLTRLNMQEKADLFMLVKSGTAQLVEACETYKISVATGGRILVDGEQGFYDKLMPPEYRSKKSAEKPNITVQRESYTDAPEPAKPEAEQPAAVEAKPKVNPLDPRLLNLAAEVKLMQERLAELQASAAALGITVNCSFEVEWT